MARDDPDFHNINVHQALGGNKPKVAIYVVDHKTSGPIARAVKVAHQLQAKGADVVLLVRSELVDDPMLPADLKKVGYSVESIGKLSRQNPQWKIAKLRPDILLVDEYPFVSSDRAYEWEKVLDAARFSNRKVKVYGMSCDIPLYNQREEADHIEGRAARLDRIMVTGDPKVVDFDEYVPAHAQNVRDKLEYVGFMAGPTAASPASDTKKAGNIVVYLGGASLDYFDRPLLSLFANIPHMNTQLQHANWHIVLPPNGHMGAIQRLRTYLGCLPEDIRSRIHLEEAGNPADFSNKLAHADMAITGGGQTATESALVAGLPTVIVPSLFREQFDRADRFSAVMPERVTKLEIPNPEISGGKSSRRHIIYQIHCAQDKRDWIERVNDWAETSVEAATMRSEIERIYAQRGAKLPNTKIMLDGARHIAQRLLPLSAEAEYSRSDFRR